jgi:aryl-alcohol dehydrogenase-like predicted oxidoreductase
MEYIALGKTGLQVSRLALGTAAFGLERYGICEADESGAVSEQTAIQLIHAAVEQGINFFDTARGYGCSEAVVGKGLAGLPTCVVATKVSVPENISDLSSLELRSTLMASLETSLRELRRDVLEIVQIHNAKAGVLESGEMLAVLETARQQGKLRFIGASVYGADNALAALRCKSIDVLQVALSLLDQRMMSSVLPEAKKKNIGVLARSVFLKGVLSERVKALPASLQVLAAASNRAREILGETWESLPSTAVRFCLSVPGVHSVLMGLRSAVELPAALAAEKAGPLPEAVMRKTETIKLTDEKMLDPSHWPML